MQWLLLTNSLGTHMFTLNEHSQTMRQSEQGTTSKGYLKRCKCTSSTITPHMVDLLTMDSSMILTTKANNFLNVGSIHIS